MTVINWIANAEAVRHIDTITIGGTIVAGDTFTVTGVSKTLVVTIGSLVSTAQVATTIQQAWNGETFTDTTASCVPSTGSAALPEFAELTATAVASTILLKGNTFGVVMPVFTVSKVSASGTIAISHTTLGTGPHDVNNALNYDGGALPTNGDTLIADRPGSMRYNLSALSAVTLAALTIGQGVTDATQIGLLKRNANGYDEWRATEFAIGATTITCRGTSGMIKINVGSVQTACTVYSGSDALEYPRNSFQLRGTHASNVLNVLGSTANVGAASNGETATFLTVTQNAGTLVVGSSVTMGTLKKVGGTADIQCAATTISSVGTTNLQTGNITTLTVQGGTTTYGGTGTITTANVLNGGTLSMDGAAGACTITTMNVTAPSYYRDSSARATITTLTPPKGLLSLASS